MPMPSAWPGFMIFQVSGLEIVRIQVLPKTNCANGWVGCWTQQIFFWSHLHDSSLETPLVTITQLLNIACQVGENNFVGISPNKELFSDARGVGEDI